MQYKWLSVLILFLLASAGCGGDSSGPAAGGPAEGAGEFGSLLESGYTVEELVGDIAEVGPQVASGLKKRLELAIADCREQVSGLQLDVQRFSADALLSSKARAIRAALKSRKAELSFLESKLAAVLKRAGLQQAPGK